MNPPFSITIEITEATQCHNAVSQLLRVFPSLRLTIESNERTPVTSGTAQAYFDSATVCRALDAIRCLGEFYRKTSGSCGVGADEARKAADDALTDYPWTPGEHTEAAADARLEADAAAAERAFRIEVHRRDDNPDAGPSDAS